MVRPFVVGGKSRDPLSAHLFQTLLQSIINKAKKGFFSLPIQGPNGDFLSFKAWNNALPLSREYHRGLLNSKPCSMPLENKQAPR